MHNIRQSRQKKNCPLKKRMSSENFLSFTVIGKNKKFLQLKFLSKNILKLSSVFVFFLTLSSSIGQLYKYIIANGENNKIISLFYLNEEKNIPTLYSSFALFFCSLLLFIIAKEKIAIRNRYRLNWLFLSVTFLCLALDESLTFHENLTPIIKKFVDFNGLLYYAWIIPASALLFVFMAINLRFVRFLPSTTKNLFLLSGIVFICGAIGMEAISGKVLLIQGKNAVYAAVATIEEFLEMMGVVVFIYALLNYIENYIDNRHIQILIKL